MDRFCVAPTANHHPTKGSCTEREQSSEPLVKRPRGDVELEASTLEPVDDLRLCRA